MNFKIKSQLNCIVILNVIIKFLITFSILDCEVMHCLIEKEILLKMLFKTLKKLVVVIKDRLIPSLMNVSVY